jgi:NADH:ubiquinone oxidoreductase subunit C
LSGERAADVLQREMPDAVVRRSVAHGEEITWIKRERLVDAVTLLRDSEDASYEVPVFVTAVDWPDREPE